MFFARRNQSASSRYLSVRVGLFFLAAGVWLAGVVVEDERFTGAAIVILLVAFVLGLAGRRQEAVAAADLAEEEAADLVEEEAEKGGPL